MRASNVTPTNNPSNNPTNAQTGSPNRRPVSNSQSPNGKADSAISRRQAILRSAGVTVLGGTLLNNVAAQADEEKDAVDTKRWPLIDAHSHIWTRDIKSFPLAKTATLDDLAPASFTTEELLATCRPHGVGRVVLIAHHTFYGFDNSYMIDAAQRYPGVFRVVGMVDETRDDVGAQMRKLAAQHVSGFRIISFIRKDKWLTSDGMHTMWRTAAKTGQSICCLMEPAHLGALNQMCAKYPDTSVVIDHFARIGIDGEIREADVAKLCGLAKNKNVTVKLSAYYALGKKKPPYDYLTPMIRRLLDAYGPERLMWASDAPYQMQADNSYGASIKFLRDELSFLSDGDRAHLLEKTAKRVFYGNLNA